MAHGSANDVHRAHVDHRRVSCEVLMGGQFAVWSEVCVAGGRKGDGDAMPTARLKS